MRDAEFLVFVEVRYRAGDDYGHPLETVTRRKQLRVCATAAHYLQSNGQLHETYCRFDVVAVGAREPPDFAWIKDAFYAAG